MKFLQFLTEPTAWLEILLLWAGIYVALRFLRGTRGFGVFRGLMVFFIATVIGILLLNLLPSGVPRLTHLLNAVLPTLVIAVIVLFHPEIRQGISRLGQHGALRFFAQEEEGEDTIRKVAAAAQRMAKERTGALIAFERFVSLAPFRANAVVIDAPVSTILIESVFFAGNPLHDGGMIIKGGNVLAAAVIFPLTENPEVQRRLGTRHRAALGITEETDAIAMVVSEETGFIALASGGQLYRKVPPDKLEEYLKQLLRKGAKHLDRDKKKEQEGPREPALVDSTEIQIKRAEEATAS